MRKTRINLRTGTTEDFFNRLRGRAKKLDRGETLPPGVTITFDDAASNFLPHLNPITTVPNAVITNKPTAYLPVPPFP